MNQKENAMARRLAWVLMSLVLAFGGPACAPKMVGPTAGSGYVFSLETYPTIIWVGVMTLRSKEQYPQAAEVIVRVQDAQGRAVDGVPVTFELEPRWANSAVLAPSQTTTRGGIARAVVSEPQTSGIVRVMVHVDNTTAQTRLTVQTYEIPTSRD
jgi:hypothetical protein